jgi:hypothetical protein
MPESAPRTDAENEAAVAAPTAVVRSRATIEPVGDGPVGVLWLQPAAANAAMRQMPRLTAVSFRECENRIVISVRKVTLRHRPPASTTRSNRIDRADDGWASRDYWRVAMKFAGSSPESTAVPVIRPLA